MRRSVFSVVGCAAILLITAVAQAQVETTPIPLNPKPDFSSMRYLLGTWNCIATNTRRPSPYTDTSTFTMDSSGYWMDNTDIAHPVSFDPHTHTTRNKTTHDASTSRWVSVSTDDGGGYGMATSSAWKGNTIVWHPVSTAPKTSNIASYGDVIETKVSDTKETYTSMFTEPSGRVVHSKSTCTKQAS